MSGIVALVKKRLSMLNVKSYLKQKREDRVLSKKIAAQIQASGGSDSEGDFSSDEDQDLLAGLIFDELQSLLPEKRKIRREFIDVLTKWSGSVELAEEFVSKIDFKELSVKALEDFLIEVSQDDTLYVNPKTARDDWMRRVEPYCDLKSKKLAIQLAKIEELDKKEKELRSQIAELEARRGLHLQGLFAHDDQPSTSSKSPSLTVQQKTAK